MNEVVRMPRSPVEDFVDQVLPSDRLQDLAREMPSHIRPDLFKRNLLNAIMINWDLMKCDPGLLFREVSKAAALGLYLDPALGEAYIILSRGEPQLRVGYRGVTKLARQSGTVSLVYAHEVREGDFIECDQGTAKRLIHKPKLFTDRGRIIGYYSVITFNDGAFDFEPMSISDIHGIRDRSDAWKAFKAKKIKSTPWSTDEPEMAKKTVIRRLMKRAPQSPELAEALRIEDAAEGYLRDRALPAPQQRRAPSPSAAPMIEAPRADMVVADGGAIVPETERQPAPAAAQPTRRAPSPSAAPATQPAAAVPPQAAAQPAQHYDPEKVRKRLAEALKAATTGDAIDEAWMQVVDPWEQEIMLPDREHFAGMCRFREGEISDDGAAV